MLTQSSFEQSLTEPFHAQAKLAVKDEYEFDFLELGEAHREGELEHALPSRIEDFLCAMSGIQGNMKLLA